MITNQQELACLVDRAFNKGCFQIKNFKFQQLFSIEESLKTEYLQAIYNDNITSSYSFESGLANVQNTVQFFINAPAEKQKTHFMVFDENGLFLGRCFLRVNSGSIHFGIALCRAAQNRGLGGQILQSLFKLCFKHLELKQGVYGTTMSHNRRSQAAMRKSGMVPDGVIEKDIEDSLDTQWLVYKITPEIYNSSEIKNKPHPGARSLRQIILQDYQESRASSNNYNSSQYARARFFMEKQLQNALLEQNNQASTASSFKSYSY